MPTPSKPRHGSMGYSPRKKADREVPSFRSWPEPSGETSPLGFAGYKAGMTHVLMINDQAGSPKEGSTESIPVTIIETPPVGVAAIRAYRDTPYGMRPITEAWMEAPDPVLEKRLTPPKEHDRDERIEDIQENIDEVAEVRLITYTNPGEVSGTNNKSPHIMEIPVGSSSAEEAVESATELLGSQITAGDVHRAGEYLDVSAVTKGKGTQGPVKRWGVKLRKGKHKRQGWRRRIGNLGPWHPSRVRSTVPQQGQTGYHQRTEANKRLISIGDDGEEVTPEGGFINYGEVDNPFILVKGSVPGPERRLVRTRNAINPKHEARYDPEIRFVSDSSKQG